MFGLIRQDTRIVLIKGKGVSQLSEPKQSF